MFTFNEEEIRKAIAVFHPGGQVFEVRLVDDKWNAAAVFDNADTLIKALKDASLRIHENANAYMTLNCLNDACHDRKHRDRFVEYAKPTVSDNDIVGYDWLLIDLDPKRPAGTSSTDEQVTASRETAKRIMRYLLERGWPDPVVGHSGNGTHLLYKIELSTERKNLLQDALKALNMLFSDNVIDVDMTTFNPGRICKLYGTVARKGASTEKRPHRMSKIKMVPEEIKTVPVELIETLADALPKQETPQKYNGYNPGAFNLQEWIDAHEIQVSAKESWSGGTKWILERCPFNPAHDHKDAAIVQTSDGKICFHCFHASCADKHWRELRLLYEPGAYQKQNDLKPAVPNYMAQMPPDFGKVKPQEEQKKSNGQTQPGIPVWRTTEEIRNREVPPEAYILTGIHGIDRRMMGLKKGYVSVLSGLRSAGKSSVLSQLVIQCRQQGMKCALFSGEMIDKQVLKWLTLQAAGKNFVHGTQYELVFYPNDDAAVAVSQWLNEFVYVYNNDCGNQFEQLEAQIIRIVQEKKLDMVLIDNLMALNIEQLDRDMYSRQTKFVKALKRLAQGLNIHVLFVAHPRKSQGYLRMDDISGSGDLSNAADNVFIIHRVDEDYKKATQQFFQWKTTNPLYQADNVIEICKDRDLGNRDVYVPLYFEPETKRLKNDSAEYVRYGWEEESGLQPTLAGYTEVEEDDDDLPF